MSDIVPPNSKYKVRDFPDHWNDSLGRDKFGKFFCNHLIEYDTSVVIELAAGYGEGKTTFLERCEKEIKAHEKANESEIKYLNIWERDFYDDPLLALLDGMLDDCQYKKIVDDFKEVFFAGSSVIIKAITLGAVDVSPLLSIKQKRIELLKKLEEYFMDKKKQIIFIDELDRCRPDFAVRTLEVIKHMFSKLNTVFVIATDDNRLHSAINSIYGSGVANEDYLRKFIDIQFVLPPIDNYDLKELCRFFNPGDFIIKPSLREVKTIEYFYDKHIISLKSDHEKYSLIKEFRSKCEKSTGDIDDTILKFMCYLRCMKPNLYFKIGNTGAFEISEMLNQLKFWALPNNQYIRTKQDFKVFLQFICRDTSEHEKFLEQICSKDSYMLNLIRNADADNKNSETVKKIFTVNNVKSLVAGFKNLSMSNERKNLIQEHALFIWLYCNINVGKISLAQEVYQIFD